MKILKMKIDLILKELKNELQSLYGKKLAEIILYGSYARGNKTSQSDIDILVVLNGKIKAGKEIDRMINIISELNLKHNSLISVIPVSLDEYESIKSPLILNIKREGISV
ncbi:MAG: nucleotidyltransferase domain-containing protein [Bacteroidetes bacterium]|nr:nucleotidyltransferase domain-containing protein [Bacteroidota bacterium]